MMPSPMPSLPAGRSPMSSMLDGPPPSPSVQTPSAAMGGISTRPSSRDLPPEVLMGLLKSGETITGMIDSMAQIAPDIAIDLASAKDLFLRAMSKLVLAGGGPMDPTSAGTSFPGSGPLQAPPGAMGT